MSPPHLQTVFSVPAIFSRVFSFAARVPPSAAGPAWPVLPLLISANRLASSGYPGSASIRTEETSASRSSAWLTVNVTDLLVTADVEGHELLSCVDISPESSIDMW